MNKRTWQPTNIPGRYDAPRVSLLNSIRQTIEQLQLPPIRLRKLLGIYNALEIQIEDSGDHPKVNEYLLEALKQGVVHQVGQKQAKTVIQAIDHFDRVEAKRWQQARSGTLLPPKLAPEDELDELMQSGYTLISSNQTAAGCDQWDLAWEKVKMMAEPVMQTAKAFDTAYPSLLQSVGQWSQDFEMELNNAGLSNPRYFEQRIQYADEYLTQFPDCDTDIHISFGRAKGEALWNLGRVDEAEAVYQSLVTTFPDKAWGYIGWSDQYYLSHKSTGDFERAEKILRQALARPNLDDPSSVEDRLLGLQSQRQEAGSKKRRRKKKPKRRR